MTEQTNEKKVVLFNIDKQEFGVNINEVKEIIKIPEITEIPEAADYVEGIISLRGEITVIINLEKKLKMPISERNDASRIIIIEHEEETLGMIVDSCNEVITIPSDSIQNTHDSIIDKISAHYIEGVAVLNNERIVVLLELDKVLSEKEFKEEVKKHTKKHT